MRDRFAGAMLGLACGDALGAPAEFKSLAQVKAQYGILRDMVGGGQWEPGEWTDDTGIALCVAEGILADSSHPVSPIGERILEWRKTAKDVGTTTSAACGLYHMYGSWPEAAQKTPQAISGKSVSNGSLMRTLPVALAYADVSRMLRRSARISAMTHWDKQAQTCCAIYCLWVHAVLQGESLRGGWHSALWQARIQSETILPDAHTPGMVAPNDKLWTRLAQVEQKSYDNLQPSGYAGYVVECLEAAAWCVLFGGSLERALIRAVNLAGEADTIGAVAGGIAGAFWGKDAIPIRWLDRLHERERLETIAHRLADLRHDLVYDTDFLAHKPFEFNEVAEGLFAGRHPLTLRDMERLAAKGVTHILDFRDTREWSKPGRFGQEAIHTAKVLGITRLHIPVTDVGAPHLSDFDAAWNALETWTRQPKARIYAHCRAGMERTGAILTACYARKHGLTYAQALQALQVGRPKIQPLPHQTQAAQAWLSSK